MINNCTNSGEVYSQSNWAAGIAGRVYGANITGSSNTGAVSGKQHVGGIVGNGHDRLIQESDNSGSISGTANVGGIAGWYDGNITTCQNTGNITSSGDNAGGIVGYNAHWTDVNIGKVDNCSSTGSINGVGRVGGIAGTNEGSATNSYNTGTIDASGYAGGVAGYQNHANASTFRCYNTGTVSLTTDYGGGVVGINFAGEINTCYNTGPVSGSTRIGGVTGENRGTVQLCFNAGTISGSGGRVGGVTGVNYLSGAATRQCYNAGKVSGSSYTGSISGYNTGTLTNNYRYEFVTVTGSVPSTNDPTSTNGGMALAAELIARDTYEGNSWGFTTSGDWQWDSTGYPKLGLGTEPNPFNFNLKTPAASDLGYSLQDYTYDGQSKQITVTSKVAGLGAITVTYNNLQTAPTNAGTYTVRAAIAESADYWGATFELGSFEINQMPVQINITNTEQAYNNSARYVTVDTVPSGVSHEVTYSQGGTPVANPTEIGVYDVKITVTDPNYSGEAAGTLTISNKLTPDVTWPTFDEITYGTALKDADIITSGSAEHGGNTVDGVFVFESPGYQPPAGTA